MNNNIDIAIRKLEKEMDTQNIEGTIGSDDKETVVSHF